MKSHFLLGAGVLLALAAAVPCGAFAQNARMMNAKDATLEWAFLDRIAEGANIPTTIQSVSVREAAFYGIAADAASKTGSPGFSGLPEGTFVRPKLAVQPFVIGWNGLDLSRNMKDCSIIDRLRLDDPVLLLGLSFGSDSFYGATEIDFGTDSLARYASADGFTGLWMPADYLTYWTFPEEGYLAWSDRHVTLAAGRFRTGIGLGKTNIFLNGDARWYDQLQFSWWTERFRFFSFWATSSSQLFNDEYEVQKYAKANDDSESWGWDALNNHDAATQSVVPLKMFSYHRFEFKPVSRVGIGIAEMQLVGGKVPDLLNLAPTVFWHNAYSAGVTNVMMQADVWSVPFDGLLLWGEYVMDDSRAPKESGASKPNCWAWELGARVAIPVDSARWRYAVDLEYSHADKWTYDRWQPYLTMYQRQIITGGHRGYDTPLGHPEGGDVDEIDFTFTALTKERHRIEFGYSWICKGPVYLGMIADNSTGAINPSATAPKYIPVYYDYDDYAGTGALKALLGSTRKHIHAFSAKATWPITAAWAVNADIDFRLILNAGHVAGKTATETVYKAGCTWNYGKETK